MVTPRIASARLANRVLVLAMASLSIVGTAGGVRAWLVQDSGEGDRLADLMKAATGAAVADIGAGDGQWTKILSARVGPTGRVFATEVNQNLIKRLESTAASLGNVTVTQGSQDHNGLPADCCDAILLRLVYHHFTDPPAMQKELRRALRMGGLLAVVEFRPGRTAAPSGVPHDRGGHGIPPELLIKELNAHGFEVVTREDQWPGGRESYCVLFRKIDLPKSTGRSSLRHPVAR
ncbi:MAG: methyltransferase domain-containing protein [Acidobacteria bacterium]|nr:methyltransferase domain-containing protein [Acidobacteriota bacterium]MBI3264024.1 methyltransferase domain-containing protein [Acidobacteriota bacterium]